jgi:hypothetical protein
MAKKRKRRAFRAARRGSGKASFCRTLKASNCSIKIGSRRYKTKSGCPTGKVKVCPTPHGRKTAYKLFGTGGSLTKLYKMPKKRSRARARRR